LVAEERVVSRRRHPWYGWIGDALLGVRDPDQEEDDDLCGSGKVLSLGSGNHLLFLSEYGSGSGRLDTAAGRSVEGSV